MASAAVSFPLFLAAFTVLFVLSGIGNGSVYKMIPAVFAKEAEDAVTSGEPAEAAFTRARRLSGAVMGIAGSIAALGGVGINLTFRASYSGAAGNANAALVTFLVFYIVCVVVTWAVYLRGTLSEAPATPAALKQSPAESKAAHG
jgi:NNP family nitrate/nitrite transporter-like MFS transporter